MIAAKTGYAKIGTSVFMDRNVHFTAIGMAPKPTLQMTCHNSR